MLLAPIMDDATLQLVPCCCKFKLPCFEELKVNIYIFKSQRRHQSFQQKSLDGDSRSAVSIVEIKSSKMVMLIKLVEINGAEFDEQRRKFTKGSAWFDFTGSWYRTTSFLTLEKILVVSKYLKAGCVNRPD